MAKMETYNDLKGISYFDWPQFLNQGVRHRTLWEKAGLKASNWRNCPCGNLNAKFPRDQFGKPKDPELFLLGRRFLKFILEKDIYESRVTFLAIQERAEVLNKYYPS